MPRPGARTRRAARPHQRPIILRVLRRSGGHRTTTLICLCTQCVRSSPPPPPSPMGTTPAISSFIMSARVVHIMPRIYLQNAFPNALAHPRASAHTQFVGCDYGRIDFAIFYSIGWAEKSHSPTIIRVVVSTLLQCAADGSKCIK